MLNEENVLLEKKKKNIEIQNERLQELSQKLDMEKQQIQRERQDLEREKALRSSAEDPAIFKPLSSSFLERNGIPLVTDDQKENQIQPQQPQQYQFSTTKSSRTSLAPPQNVTTTSSSSSSVTAASSSANRRPVAGTVSSSTSALKQYEQWISENQAKQQNQNQSFNNITTRGSSARPSTAPSGLRQPGQQPPPSSQQPTSSYQSYLFGEDE